jgi:PHP family Zn ribbon phosphoesterase
MMAKPELGTKRLCTECGTKFYDLNRDPMTCPKCGATFDLATLALTRQVAAKPREKPEHLHIHMPPPSYYPLVIALGVLLLGIGALSHLAISGLGALVIIYGTWAWALEPTD